MKKELTKAIEDCGGKETRIKDTSSDEFEIVFYIGNCLECIYILLDDNLEDIYNASINGQDFETINKLKKLLLAIKKDNETPKEAVKNFYGETIYHKNINEKDEDLKVNTNEVAKIFNK